MSKVVITGQDLTVEQIVAVCRECAPLELSEETKKSVLESRQIVDDLIAEEKVVYGITTGFGKFSDVVISQDQCKDLQKNLIITHAVGAGNHLQKISQEESCFFVSITWQKVSQESVLRHFRPWLTC